MSLASALDEGRAEQDLADDVGAGEPAPVAAFVANLRTLCPPPARAVADRQVARAAAAALAARGPLADHEIGWGNGRTTTPRHTLIVAGGALVLLLVVVLLVARAADAPDSPPPTAEPATATDRATQTIARLVPSSVPSTGASFDADLAWMANLGITMTEPDGVTPTAVVSRQAMAAFVYRVQGRPLGFQPPCASDPFTDVATTSPFCGEIAWLAQGGVTTGYPDGSFHPGAPLDRRSLAVWLYRLRHPGQRPAACTTAPFTDVAPGDDFCGEIAALHADGVATGYPDGSFRPATTVTRQAAAAILRRFASPACATGCAPGVRASGS